MATAWPGFTDGGGLLLPLDRGLHLPPEMPDRLHLDGRALERKDELHLTLLDRTRGTALRERLGEARIRRVFESLEWAVQATQRYALLHRPVDANADKPEAWSVVEHLRAPALAGFRRALAAAGGGDLDDGVPHVTLYVAGDRSGIGVPDAATWRARFVRDVDRSELAAPT